MSWKTIFLFTMIVGSLAWPLFAALTSGTDPEVNRTLQKLIFRDAAGAIPLLIDSLVAHGRAFLAMGGDERWLSNWPGRPILNPILAVSFGIGFIITLKRIKHLPYLFLIVYWLAALTPSIFTYSDSIFYFRLSSVFPPTYIIIAVAWVELSNWLTVVIPKRIKTRYPTKTKLTPAYGIALLPFLLIGLIWLPFETYRDYFLNWANQPQVAMAHDIAMFDLMGRMAGETDPQAIFILPRNAEKFRPDYTLEFLYRPYFNNLTSDQPPIHPYLVTIPAALNYQFFYGQAPLMYVMVDEPDLRHTLTLKLARYRTIYLIEEIKGGREHKYRKAYNDRALPFLFEKYGVLSTREKTDAYNILVYRLDTTSTNFQAHLQAQLPDDFKPVSNTTIGQIGLVGLKYYPQSTNLIVDLAWRPLDWIDQDYTIFIQLLDKAGHRVAGVDILPERGFSTLDQQELMLTHHNISLVNTSPGSYHLLVGLYYFDRGNIKPIGSFVDDVKF